MPNFFWLFPFISKWLLCLWFMCCWQTRERYACSQHLSAIQLRWFTAKFTTHSHTRGNEEKRLQCHWINERFHLFGASVNALAAVSAATEAALRLETQITLFQIYSDEHDRWEQCKCNPTKEFRLLVFGNSNWIRINEIRSKSRLVICLSICMQENDDMLRAQRQTEYAYENRFFFLSEWLL